LNITDKLLRPITEVNYLRAENVERYRAIVRYCFEQYEKINYWIYKEEIFSMMKEIGLFEDYTMDQCMNDLSSLVEWGNLTAMQDASKVSTIEEFKNRKFRYQLSEYTIEIERMTIRLENLDIQSASLEPSLLERISKQIMNIYSIQNASDEVVSSWWNSLNEDFIRLNRNYQDYIRDLSSAKAEEMMKTTQFLLFKDKIITYLRSFVKGLQEQGIVLEAFIRRIPDDVIKNVLEKAVAYEMSIPRLDNKLDEKELLEVFYGRWQSLYNWYVGQDTISEVERMSDVTSEIIRKITRYAQQISEYQHFNINRTEEYRHIAKIFSLCKNMEEAHKMSAMVFGVDQTFHIREFSGRTTEQIDSGVYEEPSSFIALEPRIRQAGTKSKRKPAPNYEFEQMAARMAILDEQQKRSSIRTQYIEQKVIDFSQIDHLDSYSRKLLLSWLSKALMNKDRKTRLESGEPYRVFLKDDAMCTIHCEDGDIQMPSFCIEFEGLNA